MTPCRRASWWLLRFLVLWGLAKLKMALVFPG